MISINKEQLLRKKVIKAIKTVYDPELPIDVYELGLIYKIDLDTVKKKVYILMTLTTPNCPAAEEIPHNIQKAIASLQEIESVDIQLTFDPPYTTDRLSELAKLALDL